MIVETKRCILREYQESDFEALHAIFKDPEVMKHYPSVFSDSKTKDWIKRNQRRYQEDGFGLWAVVLKENGLLIGDCGITLQNIHGQMLPEIGYHIHRDYQKQGYGSETALACMEIAFEVFKFDAVYSYMKYTNIASSKVAMKNGMKFIDAYEDDVNTITHVYAITKEQWEKRRDEYES